jgi:hypothetical protein
VTLSDAERQAAWRQSQREAGQSTHPNRAARSRVRAALAEMGVDVSDVRVREPRTRRTREYNKAWKASHAAAHPRPWCFIDTEGANDVAGIYGDRGRQYTFTITAADDLGNDYSLYYGRPLSTKEMLDFIIGLPHNEMRYRYGGYFFGYDRDQILCDMSSEDLRLVYGTPDRAGVPVYHGALYAYIFATKFIVGLPTEDGKVSHPELGAAPTRIKGPRREIWDVGKFYGAKFSTAIENWQVATASEKRFIERMKDQRASFDIDYWLTPGVADEIVRYSLLENRLAARMQTKFDATCRELGYPLTQWYGAGSMAKAMLKAHGVKEHLATRRPVRRYKRPDNDFAAQLPRAYYGGRFEIIRPGEFSPVYEYDLRSAYPASYRSLPCLVHGEWTYVNKTADRETVAPHDLYMVDWHISDSHVWGPFPQRNRRQQICYPSAGSGAIVWGEELAAARAIWADHIVAQRRWQYRTNCDCQPFDWIDRVYRARRELGKDTRGYPLKLGMNAAYGSLASTLGAEWDGTRVTRGWWAPQWAGLITAWTRARLLDALRLAGGAEADHVIMFATDAIYSTEPIALDLTDRLGGWEGHYFADGGLLIQPGLYHLRGQDVKTKLKGRGIDYRDMQEHIGDFYDAYRREGDCARVDIPIHARYQGVRSALHRRALDGAYRWAEGTRSISMDPSGKRAKAPDGRWIPKPLVNDTIGHERFQAVIDGRRPESSDSDMELYFAQVGAEVQPDGPMAI